jgi:serine/threonine protein kinase/tetratricopeptide (TPR) repeat protein
VEALRERFGKYQVLGKIAQGGMAEVYKVKSVGIAGFEKVQALKRILPSAAREGRFIRSFIDEARIAAELAHRNIVQVFDFGKADGELFLAMELIEGIDLRAAMTAAAARGAPPTVPLAAYIIAEVAAGLDYAHRKTDIYGGPLGIVHCDVSPSNVMLSQDGYVKILDFGIARATFSSALERRRLRGKPRYMAPEQTYGEPPTAAADVFALGIIAWELLTGQPLYRGADLRAILEAVRRTDPPPIERLAPAVPREIAAAVGRALQRDPAARGTVADLLAACARTAMAASAGALAQWLVELSQHPGGDDDGWQPEVTSISVPRPAGSGDPPAAGARDPAGTPGADAASLDAVLGPPDAVPLVALSDADEGPSLERALGAMAAIPAPPSEPAADAIAAREPARTARAAPHLPRAPSPGGDDEPTRPSDLDWLRTIGPAVAELGTDDVELLLDSAAGRSVEAWMAHRAPPRPAPPAAAGALEPSAAAGPGAGDAGVALDEPIDDDLGALAAGLPTERRRAVVVAAALAEAAPEVLRTVAQTLGELAYQRGGVVLTRTDDALVAVFGLEVAGEDDVAVAMGWALDACALARDATGPGGAAGPRLRVGARTGVTAVAAPDGAPRVPADAIDEARALAREAAPHRPLFVGGAGRLTSSLYALREVPGPRRVTRRGRALEVMGPRSFDERDRARRARPGRCFGRAAQLAALEAALARAVAEDRRVTAIVSGPAGIGKSRLVAELLGRLPRARDRPAGSEGASAGAGADGAPAAPEGAGAGAGAGADGAPPAPRVRVISCAASPASQLTPFALVVELYQAALSLPPGRGRSARAQLVQRLTHVLLRAGVDLAQARAIGIDLDRAMELRDGLSLGAGEVADLRPRLAAGLTQFRQVTMVAGQPLINLVEDVHVADPASLGVLEHTLRDPARPAELLIMTARSDGLAALPRGLEAEVVIELGDLVGAELRALIEDRLGAAAAPAAVAAVLARAGGNPLFVEELAEAVREAGPTGGDVPATARDVVVARLARLAPRARAALRYAAVIGGAVRTHLLEELMGPDGLDAEIDEVVAAGALVRAEASDPDAGELQFARGLVREVVYESLTERARRDCHARVGRLLASRFFAGREEPPAAIAEHLERGGEPAGAAAFWLRAGRLALTASEASSAVDCFSRALALDGDLAAPPPSPTARARRREALAGRAEAHRLLGEATSDPGDLDALSALCAGQPARLADVELLRAHRHLRLGEYAAAHAATVAAEQQAVAAAAERHRGEALRVRGEVLERLGRFDEALEAARVARAVFHDRGLVTDEMAALIGGGRIHLVRAHYDAAREAYAPVLARIERAPDPWLARIAMSHVAIIHLGLGELERAVAAAERALELCRRYGDRAREGDTLGVVGAVLLELGDLDGAAERLTEALAILEHTASRWSRADCMIDAGICDVRRGRSGGRAQIDEALLEARRIGARYIEANALVARAGAHLALGAPAPALDDAAQGAAVARESTWTGYEIQALARQGSALVALGRGTEAAPLAERALTLLDEQRYLEAAEEDTLLAISRALRAAGDAERAQLVAVRARASAQRKLDAITRPAWRASFAALPYIRDALA